MPERISMGMKWRKFTLGVDRRNIHENFHIFNVEGKRRRKLFRDMMIVKISDKVKVSFDFLGGTNVPNVRISLECY